MGDRLKHTGCETSGLSTKAEGYGEKVYVAVVRRWRASLGAEIISRCYFSRDGRGAT